MTVTVFGATGGLGRQVVLAALDEGYEVRAHARSPERLGLTDPRVSVVQGDLADLASIRRAIEGSHAVISCVGFVKGEDPAVYGTAMQAILEAMEAHSVRRLVAISGAGLELEGDRGGLGRRLILTALKIFAPGALEGKQREWAVIRDSPLDWTVVRVARMDGRPASGGVRVDLHAVAGKPMVAYADVAEWMVGQIGVDDFVRQAPFVSGS